MKIKLVLVFVFMSLSLSNLFSEEIDYDQLKIVDEVFLAMERVNGVSELIGRLPNMRRPSNYEKNLFRMLQVSRRKLSIILNHYKIRYKENFHPKWIYEEWLKTVSKIN